MNTVLFLAVSQTVLSFTDSNLTVIKNSRAKEQIREVLRTERADSMTWLCCPDGITTVEMNIMLNCICKPLWYIHHWSGFISDQTNTPCRYVNTCFWNGSQRFWLFFLCDLDDLTLLDLGCKRECSTSTLSQTHENTKGLFDPSLMPAEWGWLQGFKSEHYRRDFL